MAGQTNRRSQTSTIPQIKWTRFLPLSINLANSVHCRWPRSQAEKTSSIRCAAISTQIAHPSEFSCYMALAVQERANLHSNLLQNPRANGTPIRRMKPNHDLLTTLILSASAISSTLTLQTRTQLKRILRPLFQEKPSKQWMRVYVGLRARPTKIGSSSLITQTMST